MPDVGGCRRLAPARRPRRARKRTKTMAAAVAAGDTRVHLFAWRHAFAVSQIGPHKCRSCAHLRARRAPARSSLQRRVPACRPAPINRLPSPGADTICPSGRSARRANEHARAPFREEPGPPLGGVWRLFVCARSRPAATGSCRHERGRPVGLSASRPRRWAHFVANTTPASCIIGQPGRRFESDDFRIQHTRSLANCCSCALNGWHATGH